MFKVKLNKLAKLTDTYSYSGDSYEVKVTEENDEKYIEVSEKSEINKDRIKELKQLIREDIEGKIINRAIIHMIPTHDTTSEEGCLYGYCDALFFKIVIYNTDTMDYYSLNNRDAVNIEVPTETRIFKDLSTMIICRKPCKISIGQAVFVYSA